MKKVILVIVAAAMFFVSDAAYADTLNVISNTSVSKPPQELVSQKSFAFGGTPRIIFEVAGKTCNLTGSGSIATPKGCNYDIEVAPDGTITGRDRTGDCDSPELIARSCK